MKLYLSSYRLGNHASKLKELVDKPGARVAVCLNALDWSKDLDRRAKGLESELNDMKSLGFEPEELDLREYFSKPGLLEKMKNYDMVWFRGGNAFILVKAMKQSGFDEVIEKMVKTGRLVYAGYSAAFCVVSPSLRGVELVDDKDVEAESYESGEVWEGFGLIDFYPIVHFRSDHPESDDVEKEYEYVKSRGITLKTFKDGDVYLVDGDQRSVLV
ncbi:Type 1 glutamine amidotransferase-like domain-containing protein [Candidatus Saccharibacteria bacterium]|jgi:dipeptidase E|nr:Type 1 glutamine amidotransferase-like domain-containing protein [Candidatus Saccharibacteria bacterium]MBP7834858.1 Type 1 glutamine amidotransferase-like domain-containing protein [Candidatus Saccharibacteria bacterium]